jgi:Tfp pilus assembly protein PilX
MKTNHQSERGQALVLIVLAIFGVLGISALAIDGGMLYAERRRAQNAADTAVFAAAMAALQSADWHTAGMTQASMNGFVDDEKNDVFVNSPPTSGRYAGRPGYYQVVIRTEFSPFFAQFVYSGKLENTVESIARAKPSQSISPGNAIHATSTDQCHAVWFQGSSGTVLYDAGVYSNSSAPGSSSCASVAKKSGDLTIQNGSITAVGGILGKDEIIMKDENGNTITGGTKDALIDDNTSLPLEITDIKPPVCSGTTRHKDDAGNKVGGVYNLQPGDYPNGIKVGNDEVHLASGIYCLDDDLIMTSAQGVLIGNGVMIVMRGTDTNISVTGGRLELTSFTGGYLYDSGTPPKDWSGMLVYMGMNNLGAVNITGGANSKLWGTIYAPGEYMKGAKSAKCDITGNASTFNYRAQLICNSVRVTGNVVLEIHYEETEQYHEPPTVELTQ